MTGPGCARTMHSEQNKCSNFSNGTVDHVGISPLPKSFKTGPGWGKGCDSYRTQGTSINANQRASSALGMPVPEPARSSRHLASRRPGKYQGWRPVLAPGRIWPDANGLPTLRHGSRIRSQAPASSTQQSNRNPAVGSKPTPKLSDNTSHHPDPAALMVRSHKRTPEL